MGNNSKNYQLYKNRNYQTIKKNKKKNKTNKKEFLDINKNPIILKLRREIFQSPVNRSMKDKFCDITGYECVNTHPKNYLNYLDKYVYKYIKTLSQQKKNDFRDSRKITKGF
jgi:hypothetical protein